VRRRGRERRRVQRHAPYGPQHATIGDGDGVGVLVVEAGVAWRCGVVLRHGHRQRQRRYGKRQLQRRRHGRVQAAGSGRPEEPAAHGVAVIVAVGCCARWEADLEGQIRLGREELH
jgi:hypothetical protein